MRIDILLDLRDKLKRDEISYHSAFEVLKTLPKPWKEKEWRIERSVLIKNYCENCNSKIGPFFLQHTKQPPEFKFIKERKAYEFLKEEIGDIDAYLNNSLKAHIEKVIENNYILKPGCPQCKSLSIRQRKTMSPKYMCKCNFTFEEPETVKYYLQRLGFYDSKNGFVENSAPKETGVMHHSPYYEPLKSRTFLLICGNNYEVRNSTQVVIPILHAKCYPLNSRFKAYVPAYERIRKYFSEL